MKKLISIILVLFVALGASPVVNASTDYSNSVVNINVKYFKEVDSSGFGGNKVYVSDFGSGTGFFIADDLIVTNYHVISRVVESPIGMGTIMMSFGSVPFIDRFTKGKSVEVVGTDKSHDLAILKVRDRNTLKKSVPLQLASWTDAGIDLSGKVLTTHGFPSSKQGEMVSFDLAYQRIIAVNPFKDGSEYLHEIQTIEMTGEATTGNSGGPLLNGDGKVVSVISFGSMDNTKSYGILPQDFLTFVASYVGVEGLAVAK